MMTIGEIYLKHPIIYKQQMIAVRNNWETCKAHGLYKGGQLGYDAHVHHAGSYECATRACTRFCAEMLPSKMSEIISWVQSLPFLCHRITGHLSYDIRVSEGCNRIRFLVVTATGTKHRLSTPQEYSGEFASVIVANDHHFIP